MFSLGCQSYSESYKILLFTGERDRALQECEKLKQAKADLEEYKEGMEQDLQRADKKLAENLDTIHKLNRDKERKDKEINDLESAARAVTDMVQSPHPGFVETRSIVERLRLVPGWLRGASKKPSPKKK